ncbi:MAG: helix-turn-helix domain-containing protein, partial [Candidatus Woesearchaeota archaeon]
MCDSKIEIYTLGRFQVKKDDYIITKNNNKSHKVWCLFKILISSPQKVFSTEELMDRLDLSLELIDAKNAVQNLIYRLRKILAKNENYIAEKYIIFEEEGYSFNWRNKHYVDFIEFEKLCKKSEKAEKENKDDQVLDYAIQAIEIYQGDFLNENKE